MLSILYFTASWCGPCRAFGPVVDEVRSEMSGRVSINKIDVDQNPDLAQSHGITSIPCLVFVKNNDTLYKKPGVMSKSSLVQLIQQYS